MRRSGEYVQLRFVFVLLCLFALAPAAAGAQEMGPDEVRDVLAVVADVLRDQPSPWYADSASFSAAVGPAASRPLGEEQLRAAFGDRVKFGARWEFTSCDFAGCWITGGGTHLRLSSFELRNGSLTIGLDLAVTGKDSEGQAGPLVSLIRLELEHRGGAWRVTHPRRRDRIGSESRIGTLLRGSGLPGDRHDPAPSFVAPVTTAPPVPMPGAAEL